MTTGTSRSKWLKLFIDVHQLGAKPAGKTYEGEYREIRRSSWNRVALGCTLECGNIATDTVVDSEERQSVKLACVGEAPVVTSLLLTGGRQKLTPYESHKFYLSPGKSGRCEEPVLPVLLLRHPVRVDDEDCFLFTMKELEEVITMKNKKTTGQQLRFNSW